MFNGRLHGQYKDTEIMDDEKYMRRALALARYGCGYTAPNPMVGAVVVCDGKIIGEGFHRRYGAPHAEVNAIASVKEPELLPRSTLYVTLEPCSHYGKTPPCADLIVAKKIERVVVGCQDPFPEVAGRGIARLRAAGVEVETGCLEADCRALIRPFSVYCTQHRPYILLKWAQSADGFIDRQRDSLADGLPAQLSHPWVSYGTHRLRSEVDAILVGTRTALLDDPSLTTRLWWGKNPLRVALDRTGNIPERAKLKDGSTETLIVTEQKTPFRKGVEYVSIDFSTDILPQILDTLYERKIQTLLVEGGARLLNLFIEHDLWDEMRVERSAIRLHNGVPAPKIMFAPARRETIGSSTVEYYYSPSGT
jgi:diaminohydroxyphosphoribosylaminopyrimidine deaminase/5-amino-6-(5-phosphoribosylamino)uracil reductase